MSFLDRRQWLVRIQYCARSAFALTKGKILLTYSTLTPPCLEFDSDEKTKAITKKRSRGCIYTQHYCANEAGDRIKEIKIKVARYKSKATTRDSHGGTGKQETAAGRKAGGGPEGQDLPSAALPGLVPGYLQPPSSPRRPQTARSGRVPG